MACKRARKVDHRDVTSSGRVLHTVINRLAHGPSPEARKITVRVRKVYEIEFAAPSADPVARAHQDLTEHRKFLAEISAVVSDQDRTQSDRRPLLVMRTRFQS